jgi:hypothetical protein
MKFLYKVESKAYVIEGGEVLIFENRAMNGPIYQLGLSDRYLK